MTGSPAPAGASFLLKSEKRTRITVEGGTVRKVYRVHPLLIWRTFLRESRGVREFRNLREMAARGIPVVVPLGSREGRRLGLCSWSELTTKLVPRSVNFRDLIRQTAARSEPEALATFKAAAALVGSSLRRIHERGVLFGSASPRNWILDLDRFPAEEGCLVCDPAYAIFYRRSLLATLRASVDLYSLVFSHGRRTTLSRADRLRCLLGYTRGDRALAERIWRRLSRRTKAAQVLLRTVFVLAGAARRILRGRDAR